MGNDGHCLTDCIVKSLMILNLLPYYNNFAASKNIHILRRQKTTIPRYLHNVTLFNKSRRLLKVENLLHPLFFTIVSEGKHV